MGRPEDPSVQGRDPIRYDTKPEAYLYARDMREGKYHRFLARILT